MKLRFVQSAAVALLLMVVSFVGIPVSAASVEPIFVDGNPTCEDLAPEGANWIELKIDPVEDGTYNDGTLEVTIVVSDTANGPTFDFTANLGIDAVFVKGGNNGNLYQYDPPGPEVTSDTGLHAPKNPSGKYAGLSHLSFCYDLNVEVSKTAETSFTRTYEWTISKTADQTELLLAEGQLFDVKYGVIVDTLGYTDSDWSVSGQIEIYNPASVAATITGVSDEISGVGAVTVDCGVTFPYALLAKATLLCTYESALDNADQRLNTATVATTGVIGGGEATKAVIFGDPTNLVDECIDVNDTLAGFLGTVCVDDPLPYTFSYFLSFGTAPDADVVLVCGENIVDNTSSFVSNDTKATGSDDHTVIVTVACEQGCTLTQGYWKTHSEFGPAPYDDTWAQLPNGAITTFFLSGQTWYQVFWSAPAGNAYYNLAHQYMAAKLNELNGADVPTEVQDALLQAEALFNTYTPAQVAAMKGNNAERKQFIELAGILASYNEGAIGPGHCSEESIISFTLPSGWKVLIPVLSR